MTQPVDPDQQRVERVLEQTLASLHTPEEAREVIERIERLGADLTEEDLAQFAAVPTAAAEPPTRAAAATIEQAAAKPQPDAALADALAVAAAESVV
ncbi:MAG: hypothetical protein M3336_11665, partial [Chloroflexota bacterium]|nr:hypothetical protein [Chloroflexota bacterium]